MDDRLEITQFNDPVRRDEAGEQIVRGEVEQSPHLVGYEQALYFKEQVITPEAQVSAVLPEEKCGMPAVGEIAVELARPVPSPFGVSRRQLWDA